MVERERISAFMDGELGDDEVDGQVRRLKSDEHAADWATYHLIGDVLRGERTQLSAGFTGRFSAALAQEPTVLAPPAAVPRKRNLQWYAMSAAASVAGIAVVGWLAFLQQPVGSDGTAGTGGGSSVAAVAQAGPEMGEYLRVHQEVSPTAAMHGVASYIRTVTTQESIDGR
jgi:sigma-E factor negative regulatory protein RseA